MTSPIRKNALHTAVLAGDLAQVRELLAAGADVNAYTLCRDRSRGIGAATPLYFAVRNTWSSTRKIPLATRLAVLDEILAAGPDLNTPAGPKYDRETPLYMAVGYSSPACVVDRLLAAGADVNAVSTPSRAPAFFSVLYRKHDFISILDRLVASGADLDLADRDGCDLRHAAEISYGNAYPEQCAAVLAWIAARERAAARSETAMALAPTRARAARVRC